MKKLFIGTSGFYYSHWEQDFYPEKLPRSNWLQYFSTKFNTVEINSTYYHFPRETSVQRWKEQTPDNFIFTFKASRFITHNREPTVRQDLLDRFFHLLTPFSHSSPNHLILLQLPQWLTCDAEWLEILFSALPKTFLYACEFRHESWFADQVYKILHSNNAALVLSDSPRVKGEYMWPYLDKETSNFFYIRFHGPDRLYGSSYSDEQLQHYAHIIHNKLQKDMAVYVYFNNDIDGHAVKNAQTLRNLVGNLGNEKK